MDGDLLSQGSFDRHQKDEKQSQTWSHPVVLNLGPLDWESSHLTNTNILKIITGDMIKSPNLPQTKSISYAQGIH